MISVPSLSFLGFAFAAIAVQNLLPGRLRASVVFPLANACFLLMVMPNWQALALLAMFLVFSYASILIASRKNILAFTCALVAVVGFFAWVKGYPFLSSLTLVNNLPTVVGLSYILIRSLQVIIDTYEGALSYPPSLWRFLTFVCAWPMLLSGPIQSYQDFTKQLELLQDLRVDWNIVRDSLSRIVWGIFSVVVIADCAYGVHLEAYGIAVGDYAKLPLLTLVNVPQSMVEPFSILNLLLVPKAFGQLMTGIESAPIVMLAFTQLAYLVFLYFNFSGYTHIVIGFGYLAGLKIPENFNRPWSSRSFLDIWTRWHMTLANWFKAYVFNTMMRKLLTAWPSKKLSPYYAVMAFFVTFFLVGIWHGASWPFFLCGFGLGFGASINKLWQIQIRKTLGKEANSKLTASPIYQALCGALSLAYLAIAITPFWAGSDEIVKISFSYGALRQSLALFIAMLVIIPVSAICQAGERYTTQINRFMANPYFVGFTLAATVIYVFVTPEIDIRSVYQGF